MRREKSNNFLKNLDLKWTLWGKMEINLPVREG
jgi:hypothetical protein